MACIDALEVIICMTKLSGIAPDYSQLKKKDIQKNIELSVDAITLKKFGYTHYRVTKPGEKSSSLVILDGAIEGYPTCTIRLYAYPNMHQVTADAFHDDRAMIGDCFSYKLNNDQGLQCFFEDQNGYTDISRITSEMKPSRWFKEKLMERCIEL